MLVAVLVKMLGGVWTLRAKCRTTHRPGLRRAYGIIYKTYLAGKGAWISLDASFESTPCLPHGLFGIFISGGASIGRDCVLFQHVTIGSNTLIDSKHRGAPQLGDNCYIGAGAKIIGRITIGDNVRIGANAVVHRDVPDNAVVTLGEQHVTSRDRPLNNRFYHKYKGTWRYFEEGQWIRETEPQLLSHLCNGAATRSSHTDPDTAA